MSYKSVLFLLVLLLNKSGKESPNLDERILGITMVAPPQPINESTIDRFRETNAKWISFVPYGFLRKNETEIKYNLEKQWWGEKMEGLEACILLSKKAGLKIMLKPQIYMHGIWIGDMDFPTEIAWKEWEHSYRKYLMDYTSLAAKMGVEMICIGTELNISVEKRPQFWISLIKEIRETYKGKLVYSANWDHYDNIPFWQDLDYIGISAYFPLTSEKTPTIELLKRKWKPVTNKLRTFSKLQNRKILFTEYGYLTVDGCADKCWILEKEINQLSINQRAQANAFEALYLSLWGEKFWAGGFIWKWFPDGMGDEGFPEKDYCPQNKYSEKIIKKWYNTTQ